MRVRDKEKKSAGILLATADAVVLVLSFLVAAALMLSYLAPHVDPRRAAWFAFLGLAAPFLYVADVVLALYWTMRWRPVALLLLFAALLDVPGLFVCFLGFSISLSTNSSTRPQRVQTIWS